MYVACSLGMVHQLIFKVDGAGDEPPEKDDRESQSKKELESPRDAEATMRAKIEAIVYEKLGAPLAELREAIERRERERAAEKADEEQAKKQQQEQDEAAAKAQEQEEAQEKKVAGLNAIIQQMVGPLLSEVQELDKELAKEREKEKEWLRKQQEAEDAAPLQDRLARPESQIGYNERVLRDAAIDLARATVNFRVTIVNATLGQATADALVQLNTITGAVNQYNSSVLHAYRMNWWRVLQALNQLRIWIARESAAVIQQLPRQPDQDVVGAADHLFDRFGPLIMQVEAQHEHNMERFRRALQSSWTGFMDPSMTHRTLPVPCEVGLILPDLQAAVVRYQ